MIWDLHCHLNGLDGRTPGERMARLVEIADRMGIERMCVYMGWPFSQDPSPARLREENDMVLTALEHWHDRAFGFVYVSAKHVETSLAEIDRCVANGPMVGIKLWVARHCNEVEIDPIIRRAAELKAVIFQHTWAKTDGTQYAGESTPAELVAMARRHPDVKFICGHTGGTWEIGVRTVRDEKNVLVDLAGSDPTNGLTEMAVRELGHERVIYGSDAAGRSFASQLAKVRGARVSDAAKRAIFRDNLRNLMLPILRDKGVKA
ncbi:MAG: amidohydrolase family protein [Planctomycetes bacterium]|nr:amidohydrolase family protein [Planctomycetota bacterium]